MVTYGYPGCTLEAELALAIRFGVEVLEILPEWSVYPDPGHLRLCVADHGLAIHSAHGSWGGRTIRANRVDLGSTNPAIHRESVDDLKRCADWLNEAGGTCLVVHPGGLSDPADQVGTLAQAAARPADSSEVGRARLHTGCPDLCRKYATGRPSREPDGRSRRTAERNP